MSVTSPTEQAKPPLRPKKGDLIGGLAIHVGALLGVLMAGVLGIASADPQGDTGAIAVVAWLLLYVPILWVFFFGVILRRWDNGGSFDELAQSTAAFAAVALVPPLLLAAFSAKARKFAGLRDYEGPFLRRLAPSKITVPHPPSLRRAAYEHPLRVAVLAGVGFLALIVALVVIDAVVKSQ